jgi:MFS family permease
MVLLWAGAPFAFLLIYGLGYGATFVLLQRLTAEYFGDRDYARILGTITMIEILGGVIGGRITGYLADLAGGDYSTAFYVMIVVTACAFLCMLTLNVWKSTEKSIAS